MRWWQKAAPSVNTSLPVYLTICKTHCVLPFSQFPHNDTVVPNWTVPVDNTVRAARTIPGRPKASISVGWLRLNDTVCTWFWYTLSIRRFRVRDRTFKVLLRTWFHRSYPVIVLSRAHFQLSRQLSPRTHQFLHCTWGSPVTKHVDNLNWKITEQFDLAEGFLKSGITLFLMAVPEPLQYSTVNYIVFQTIFQHARHHRPLSTTSRYSYHEILYTVMWKLTCQLVGWFLDKIQSRFQSHTANLLRLGRYHIQYPLN